MIIEHPQVALDRMKAVMALKVSYEKLRERVLRDAGEVPDERRKEDKSNVA